MNERKKELLNDSNTEAKNVSTIFFSESSIHPQVPEVSSASHDFVNEWSH